MDLVLDRVVRADVYFSAFITGNVEPMVPDIENWKNKWNIILRILQSQSNIIKNFEKDSKEILDALEKGNYVMHHSSHYRKVYTPHYRIFTLSNLKKIQSVFESSESVIY